MSYNFPSIGQTGYTLGQNTIYAATTDNLNTLVANVNAVGGGTIYLGAATYTLSTAITGLSRVSIIGISPSATTINCGTSTKNIALAGTNIYTTGTITSITSGVNVTGSGTLWLANVTAGQYLFLGTRWYMIGAVLTNTTLTLAEAYGDNISFPGAAYRIATPIVDVTLGNFTITGSTGTGISFADAVNIQLTDIVSQSNNKGLTFTNVTKLSIDKVAGVASTSSGVEFTNVGLCNWQSLDLQGNGANGVLMNNVKTVSALISSVANTGDGLNITNASNLQMTLEASGNGGQGVELVSATSANVITAIVNGNSSDGIRLTASALNNILVNCQIVGNGGWGINIVDGTSVNNIIDAVYESSNSSGPLQDNGTGTINIGAVVNVPGNAATATALQNARLIGGVSFNGTADITVATATGGFTITGGDLNSTGTRVQKGWFTDITVTNAISGSVTGNAGTVSNATFTTALTVNGGTLTLTANVANTSVLTIGAGAVSVSGSNTGDQTLLGLQSSTVSATGQTADIADTAFSVNTAGLYRINFYLVTTTADGAAGAVTLNLKFTDPAAARTLSTSAVPLTATTNFAEGSITARLASGNLTYGVTHTGSYGTAAYALYLTQERLQ